MVILSVQEFKKLREGKNNVVIIDARGGVDALDRYKKGHLKGAFFANLESDLSDIGDDAAFGGRHPLASPQKFSAYLSSKGIDNDSIVVVYDDKNGANAAARFWWMLKSAGHQEVHVISGGLQALNDGGFDMATGDEESVSPSNYQFADWKWPMVSIDDVAIAASQKDHLVIDVRENYRFRGESEPIDLVAGHIPGAVNVPYATNMDDDGKFLSNDLLKKKYLEVLDGRKPSDVVVHCGSGVTACHTLLALSDAGLEGASLYVGSWSEWSRNERPIATDL